MGSQWRARACPTPSLYKKHYILETVQIRWWSNIKCCLGSIVIFFRGSGPSIAKKPYIFVIFQGVRISGPPFWIRPWVSPKICGRWYFQIVAALKNGAWCFGCLLGPPGFTCWISFAPVFSLIYCWVLILALSPCCILICVLGDDALVGWGSFVRTRYLCVLVHIWIKGEVGAVGPV